jgi:methylisocitrate lyase
MARTDSLANEGLDAAIERGARYLEAGADMLFPEAVTTLAEYRAFADALDVPLLANLTEFGKTPQFGRDELRAAGVDLLLYPLSAFRAISKAALTVYEAILRDGDQRAVLPLMQTREELYVHLDYYSYERKLDELFGSTAATAPVISGNTQHE